MTVEVVQSEVMSLCNKVRSTDIHVCARLYLDI